MGTVRRRFIAPVSFGLGDLVVSLPVVQAAVRHGRCSGTETWLVTRSQSQAGLAERISGLSGTVVENDVAIDPETFIDLRDHPLQRDHWWGTDEFEAAYGPLSINEIITRIGADLGVIGDFSAPSPSRPGAPVLTPRVLFCSSPTPAGRRSDGRPSAGSSLPGFSDAEAWASPSSPMAKATTPWSIED